MGWGDPEVSKESWKVTWEKMGGKAENNKYWWCCGKIRTLDTAGGNEKWHSHCRKQFIGSSNS